MFGVGRSGVMEKTSLLSLTSEERRTRPHKDCTSSTAFSNRLGRAVSIFADRRLALQQGTDELGLAPRSGLVEYMREMRPHRRQRDANPVGTACNPSFAIPLPRAASAALTLFLVNVRLL
jgi:hypothetical protein